MKADKSSSAPSTSDSDQTLTPEQRAIHARMKAAFRADLKKKFNYDLPKE